VFERGLGWGEQGKNVRYANNFYSSKSDGFSRGKVIDILYHTQILVYPICEIEYLTMINSPSIQKGMGHAVDSSQLADWSCQAGWDIEYQQVGRGSFSGWFTATVGDQLVFTNQFCNRELLICGCPHEYGVALVLPVSDSRLGSYEGRPLGLTDAIFLLPDDERVLRTPDNLRACTISVPLRLLESTLQRYDHQCLSQILPKSRAIPLPPALIRFFTNTVSTLTMPDNCMPHPNFIVECEDRILQTAVEVISGLKEIPSSQNRRLDNRRRYVRLAREYIEMHLQDVVSISKVAECLNITTRTLQMAFQEVLGVSPMQYLRSRRLNRIRQQLIDKNREHKTITELAFENGLYHLGRFARDYKTTFGELPSRSRKI
jgi:AraC family ethanolamine operon transcriptional activator